jgi:predicted DNA-binding transcriptional regulator YafY
VPAAHLASLAQACEANELVSFDYRSREGKHTSRRAEPYRLVSDAITSSGYHYQAVVAFQCMVEEVRRRVPPHVGAVETSADGAVLRIGANQAAWLTSYLIGLGLAFEVVSPPELREGVLAIAQRAAASHNTP